MKRHGPAAWISLISLGPVLLAQGPVIVVEARQPGANASIMADSVAAPIEQQIHGLDGAVRLISRSGDDGRFALSVAFRPGTRLDEAKANVQNRLTLALPILPESVRRGGVTVTRKDPIRAVICVSSPTGRNDLAAMGTSASELKNELAKVPGVGTITILGSAEPRVRIWLDPDRLRALNLSAIDIARVLENQAAKSQPKTADATERLKAVNELEQLVVKTTDSGTVVRLNDVARVELGVQTIEHAAVQGRPCVALLISGEGKDMMTHLANRTQQFGAALPEGLSVNSPWDLASGLAAGEFALLDLSLAEGGSAERIRDALSRCALALRQVDGVAEVLALSANPFDLDRLAPCLLVRLAPNSQSLQNRQLIRQLRARLGTDAEYALRLRSGWSSEFAYPIDLAIRGPELSETRQLAEQFVRRLRELTTLTDVTINSDSKLRTRIDVDIDRKKAAAIGLNLQEIADTVALSTGSVAVGENDRAGLRWYLGVPSDGQFGPPMDAIKQVRLPNAQGQMVPLGTVIDLRTIAAPAAIYRLDTKPMVRVTASLTGDATLAAARAECEKAFGRSLEEQRHTEEYRLIWLNGR